MIANKDELQRAQAELFTKYAAYVEIEIAPLDFRRPVKAFYKLARRAGYSLGHRPKRESAMNQAIGEVLPFSDADLAAIFLYRSITATDPEQAAQYLRYAQAFFASATKRMRSSITTD